MTTKQQKILVLKLAGATMIGMPLIAIIIDAFSDSFDLRARLLGGRELWRQLIVGLVVGVIIAAIAQFIVKLRFMTQINNRYVDMIGALKLSRSEMVFISICAGVGEEILFRGSIQPLAGIFITSIVFVGMHGYINFKDWRISVYGIYMTGAICLLGYLTEVLGIWCAILAHIVIDIYLLLILYHDQKSDSEDDIFTPREETIDE